jgi:hypothetical protein
VSVVVDVDAAFCRHERPAMSQGRPVLIASGDSQPRSERRDLADTVLESTGERQREMQQRGSSFVIRHDAHVDEAPGIGRPMLWGPCVHGKVRSAGTRQKFAESIVTRFYSTVTNAPIPNDVGSM